MASLDFSNIEGGDDENEGDEFPQLAELLVRHKTDTEKAKIYHQVESGNIQTAWARATSTKDHASLRSTNDDCIETGGLTTLHEAALQGNVETIKAALEEDADIEEFSQAGATPLILAASTGHYDAIKELLASGANVNGTSRQGWTALMIAVRNRNARTVEQLICNGADMNLLSPDRWTALAEASYQGHREIMRTLLQCGADTESRAAYDRTPLMQASYKGDEAAVRLLLEAGSNTEATSAHGETAISLAAGGGFTNIVRMLLMYGRAPAPAWAKDQKDISTEVSQKAKAKGTDDQEDKTHVRGVTPLMHASQEGHAKIGPMLLERNENTEARSPYGKTAVEVARENGRIDMASILEFARHDNAIMARQARRNSV